VWRGRGRKAPDYPLAPWLLFIVWRLIPP